MSIRLEEVRFTYQEDTPFQAQALHGVSCTIPEGKITGIIGPTGSGKSTLLQLLNGLLKPVSGRVWVDGTLTVGLKRHELLSLRRKVNLVFQSSEDQLFEPTVFDDIAFGPRKTGLPDREVKERVRWAMEMTGLDFGVYKDRSPQQLSGGQKRRVALAGALAMKPGYLLLDEPGAGLDPGGRQQLLEIIRVLSCQYHTAVVLVSHRLEDIVAVCDHVVVLKNGCVLLEGAVRNLMARGNDLRQLGFELPSINELLWQLKEYRPEIDPSCLTITEAADEIARVFKPS